MVHRRSRACLSANRPPGFFLFIRRNRTGIDFIFHRFLIFYMHAVYLPTGVWMIRKKIVGALILILGLSGIVSAMERFELVTTQELMDLLEDRKEKQIEFSLVNTIDSLIFNHHTIPGSINIPWSRVPELAAPLLGDRPDQLIITFCMGYR